MTGSDAEAARPDLLATAAEEGPAGFEDCLAGLDAGWRGRHQVARPTGWTDLRAAIVEMPDGAPRRGPLLDAAARLDALFGDPRGIDRLADTARDAGLPSHVRAAALDALVDVRADEAQRLAQGLLLEPGLSLAAIRSLLATGADEDARRIVDAYPRLDEAHRDAALSALAARVSWGGILIDGVEDGRIPNTAITPLLTRQLAGLGDALLRSRLAAIGPPTTTGHDASAANVVSTADVVVTRLDAWKARLSPQILAGGDPAAGRSVWQKQCAACHRMHGEGGSLGPDLTGSGRRDLDYLLANIVTPSATVSPDYSMKQVVLADGRVLSGIIPRRTKETLLLRTQTGEETIPVDDVEEVIDGGVSLMPEGLLDRLDDAEAIDLIRFLMEP
jgi:putative heme-binding domain-containing protein